MSSTLVEHELATQGVISGKALANLSQNTLFRHESAKNFVFRFQRFAFYMIVKSKHKATTFGPWLVLGGNVRVWNELSSDFKGTTDLTDIGT